MYFICYNIQKTGGRVLMSELSLKIIIGEVDIEISGDGEMVYKVFSELKESGLGKISTLNTIGTSDAKQKSKVDIEISEDSKIVPKSAKKDGKAQKTKLTKRKSVRIQPHLIKDLDLGSNEDKNGLKEFYNEKSPKTTIEKSTVFIYYMEKIKGINDITIDHVFTCYKHVGERVPANLDQNLRHISSSKYGYIDKTNGISKMVVIGENFVEHDLPIKVN